MQHSVTHKDATLYCPTSAHNVNKPVPTRFGLQGNHHQGATDST